MIQPLIASLCVALLSLVGVLFFGKDAHMRSAHRFVLPTAVGVFLGVIFFELIPETLEASHEWGPVAIIGGFLGFYLLSYILDTYHHHHADDDDSCESHGARKLLIGDSVHNFADGVVIASAFIINPAVGILTTIGIALHEIPQEIAEFSVLRHSGYTKMQALVWNFLSSTTVIVGTLVTLLFSEFFETYVFILTGIAAGNLLYIATADFIPELRETHKDHFPYTFTATFLGVLIIGILIHFTHSLVG